MNEPFESTIALSDLFHLLKIHRKTLLRFSLFLAALAFLFFASRPIHYLSETIFQEADVSNDREYGMPELMVQKMLSKKGGSQALTILESRSLLEKVVHSLDLQATLTERSWLQRILSNIRENLIVEYFDWMDESFPLDDLRPDIKVKELRFDGVQPLEYEITFHSEEWFSVKDKGGVVRGEGRLDHPFQEKQSSFTLIKESDRPISSKSYWMTIEPLPIAVKRLQKQIAIEPVHPEGSLFRITYPHRDRKLAADVLNALTDFYQGYIEEEAKRISDEQLDYLHQREEKMDLTFKNFLHQYAINRLSESPLVTSSHKDSSMEVAIEALQRCQKAIYEVELQLERYRKFQKEERDPTSLVLSEAIPNGVKELLFQLQEYKLEQSAFDCRAKETNSHFPLAEDHSLQGFMAQEYSLDHRWTDRSRPIRSTTMVGMNERGLDHETRETPYELDDSFGFKEMDLRVAKSVYQSYCSHGSQVENRLLQLRFMLDHFDEPTFELSSLSAIKFDSVIQSATQKISEMEIALEDITRRYGLGEIDRLHKEIDGQRRFLKSHLTQLLALFQQEKDSIHLRMILLQTRMGELLEQQILAIHRQVDQCIALHIIHLEDEHSLLLDQEQKLCRQVMENTDRWVREKVIDKKLAMNTAMAEELARLVEGKNIVQNLDVVRSKAIDEAVPMLNPHPPHLLAFTFLTTILGAIVGIFYLFIRGIFRGVPLSPNNLILQGIDYLAQEPSTADSISEVMAHKIIDRLEAPCLLQEGLIVLFQQKKSRVGFSLARLLSTMEQRVLCIDFTGEGRGKNSLLDFLEKRCDSPSILRASEGYDKLDGGAIASLAIDLFRTKRFTQWLESMKGEYSFIVAVSDDKLLSREMWSLLQPFAIAIFGLHRGMNLYDLTPLFDWAKRKRAQRSLFYLLDEESF